MHAGATVEAAPVPAIGHGVEPIVLIDGVPEPRLVVRRYEATSPLDRRTVLLTTTDEHLIELEAWPATTPTLNGTTNDPASYPDTRVTPPVDRWIDSTATLAVPLRLVDDQVRWSVLAHGRLTRADASLSSRSDETLLEMTDAWETAIGGLEATVLAVWWQSADGLLYDDSRPAVMRTGSRANRSTLTWPIHPTTLGAGVHVFQENGQAWTVGHALETLDALAGMGLILTLVPSNVLDLPLQASIDLNRPLGEVLLRLLEPCGLVIQRDLRRESGQILERRVVRPIDRGRTVSLAWGRESNGAGLGQVLEIESDRPSPAAQQWVAQADGWLVESTFLLVPGWDASLEGQPDSTYSKASNPQFSTVANVYRLWVLNEDGRFSDEPFNRGPAFDLTTFFNQSDPNPGSLPEAFPGTLPGTLPGAGIIRPRPLRFLPMLTLDDAGARRSPIVELSLDDGESWSLYTGQVIIRNDRAAVYLDDTTLDAVFLTAAKAGQARVRVTAGLQSPAPVALQRWSGNPFAGTRPTRTFDLGDTFQFRRLAPPAPGSTPAPGSAPGCTPGGTSGGNTTQNPSHDGVTTAASLGSIHFDDVVNGTLMADLSDQSTAMLVWLTHMVDRSRRVPASGSDRGRARLTLTGAWPMLRVGDRLTHTGGSGIDTAGRSEAIAQDGAIVQSVRVNFHDSISPTDSRSPRGSVRRAPSSVVGLVF